MKKLLMAAGLVLAMTGLATAQTAPAATTKKTVKTEQQAKGSMAKHSHHGKKHHQAAKPAK